MHNYISIAQTGGVFISNKMYESTIKTYKLTKEHDYVKV